MAFTTGTLVRWISAATLAAALAACGGGGSGGDGDGQVGVPGDSRNGDYTLMAANAQEYVLTLNFDARTWRIAGAGLNQSGGLSSDGNGAFQITPSNSTGAAGTDTLRFTYLDDTVVGGFNPGDGVVPFVASRDLGRSIADAVGTYNLLGRVVDSAGPENTTIQQGEVTAGGLLRLCNDNQIFTIDACPAASVSSGPITVVNGLYSAATSAGAITFRIARVGDERIFLRAGASTGTTRRFMVGTPAGNTFASGIFQGADTDATWGTDTIGNGAYFRNAVAPNGSAVARAGTTTPVGVANNLANLLAITTADRGSFFAIRSGELGIVSAARGNATVPGYFAIGKRQ